MASKSEQASALKGQMAALEEAAHAAQGNASVTEQRLRAEAEAAAERAAAQESKVRERKYFFLTSQFTQRDFRNYSVSIFF